MISEAEIEFAVQRIAKIAVEVTRRALNGAAENPDVVVLERDVSCGALEVGRAVLAEILAAAGTGDVGTTVILQQPDGSAKWYERRALEVGIMRSTMGEVRYVRWRYVSADGAVIYPFDAYLGLSQKEVTPLHQEELVRLGEKQAFRGVKDDVQARSGVSMSVRTVEDILRYRATAAAEFEQQVPAPVAAKENLVVVNIDGKGIPMLKDRGQQAQRKRLKPGEKANKRKMATIAVVYEVEPHMVSAADIASTQREGGRNTRPPVQNKRVIADLEDRDWVFEELRREVRARLAGGAQLVIAVDGEPELRKKVIEYFGDQSALVLMDWYHVSEYIWGAAHALSPKNPEAWFEKQALRLLTGDVATVLRGMRQSITKRGGRAPLAVTKAIRYLHERKHFLEYAEAIQIGAPIGTGAVEGACAHVIRTRMERPGMRWSVPGAQAVLHLRCIAASGMREDHSTWFRQREIQRLYPWRSQIIKLVGARRCVG